MSSTSLFLSCTAKLCFDSVQRLLILQEGDLWVIKLYCFLRVFVNTMNAFQKREWHIFEGQLINLPSCGKKGQKHFPLGILFMSKEQVNSEDAHFFMLKSYGCSFALWIRSQTLFKKEIIIMTLLIDHRYRIHPMYKRRQTLY